MTQPTPLDVLRWNQRYYRTWHISEAETSLLRAWRLWRARGGGSGSPQGSMGRTAADEGEAT
jgi:hypothetical protein